MLTEVGAAPSGGVWADRAALASGRDGVSTLQHLLALDLVAENGPVVADADLAGGGLPDVPV